MAKVLNNGQRFRSELKNTVCGLCCRQAVAFFQYLVGHSGRI